MSVRTAPSATERTRAHRQRLRNAGEAEVLVQLPRKTIAMIDDLKERQKLPSRSLALLQLIERGMQTAQ